jgi:phosphoglycolate phosphatase-like HAD superfamily hydrolase
MFAGYIFDVEGTLVDSVSYNLRSFQESLEQMGYVVPFETLQLYSGLDGDQAIQILIPALDEGARKQVLGLKSKIFREKYLDIVKPFPGVRNVFKSLSATGGKIALATDCKGPELGHYMSLINVADLVNATACGDDVQHGKPDPRLVNMAVKKLGVGSSQAVMIGDTPYDAEAGREAGTAAAGLLTGGFAADALAEAGCFAVAEDLQSLLPALETAEVLADNKPAK